MDVVIEAATEWQAVTAGLVCHTSDASSSANCNTGLEMITVVTMVTIIVTIITTTHANQVYVRVEQV